MRCNFSITLGQSSGFRNGLHCACEFYTHPHAHTPLQPGTCPDFIELPFLCSIRAWFKTGRGEVTTLRLQENPAFRLNVFLIILFIPCYQARCHLFWETLRTYVKKQAVSWHGLSVSAFCAMKSCHRLLNQASIREFTRPQRLNRKVFA